MNTVCPICSSDKINFRPVTKQVSVLQVTQKYIEILHLCEGCEEEGEFNELLVPVNARLREEATRLAIITEVNRLLGGSSRPPARSAPHIERTLGLPRGTLTAWAKNGASLAELFLLNAYFDDPDHIAAISQPQECV